MYNPKDGCDTFFPNVRNHTQYYMTSQPEDHSRYLHRNENFKSQIIHSYVLSKLQKFVWGEIIG